jgi:hypothetical protein
MDKENKHAKTTLSLERINTTPKVKSRQRAGVSSFTPAQDAMIWEEKQKPSANVNWKRLYEAMPNRSHDQISRRFKLLSEKNEEKGKKKTTKSRNDDAVQERPKKKAKTSTIKAEVDKKVVENKSSNKTIIRKPQTVEVELHTDIKYLGHLMKLRVNDLIDKGQYNKMKQICNDHLYSIELKMLFGAIGNAIAKDKLVATWNTELEQVFDRVLDHLSNK